MKEKYIINIKLNTSETCGYKTIFCAFCFDKFGA